MTIIHKVVEGGGEQYLGWALARERALRGQGGNRSIKYDLGDAEVEIRVVGNQSFIFMRDVGAGSTEWVAYSCMSSLAFSDANIVDVLPPPDIPKPVAPQKPAYPPPPPFTFEPEVPQWAQCNSGPGQGSCQTGWVGGTDAYNAVQAQASAALTPAALEYYRAIWGPDFAMNNPGWTAAPSGVGAVACVPGVDGDICERAVPGFVYAWSDGPYFEAMNALFAAEEAYDAACAAIDAAYGAAFAQYTQEVANWSAAVFDARVSAYYSAGRARRAAHVVSVEADQSAGLSSQLVSLPALRPTYTPKEEPEHPFVVSTTLSESLTTTVVSQQVWAPGTATTSVCTASIVPVASTLPTPTDGVAVQGLYAPNSVRVGDRTFAEFPTSGTSGFGFLVSGTKAVANASSDASAFFFTKLTEYKAWRASVRKAGVSRLSFDLIPPEKAGVFYFAFLEFYAYDFCTDEWRWMPSLKLQDAPVARFEDIDDFLSLIPAYREATYPDMPDRASSVTSVRIRKVLRQRVSVGVVGTTEDITPSTTPTFDVPAYPGTTRDDLPDFLVAAVGTDRWAGPKNPGFSTGFGRAEYATLTPTSPAETLISDIYRICMSKFGLTQE